MAWHVILHTLYLVWKSYQTVLKINAERSTKEHYIPNLILTWFWLPKSGAKSSQKWPRIVLSMKMPHQALPKLSRRPQKPLLMFKNGSNILPASSRWRQNGSNTSSKANNYTLTIAYNMRWTYICLEDITQPNPIRKSHVQKTNARWQNWGWQFPISACRTHTQSYPIS